MWPPTTIGSGRCTGRGWASTPSKSTYSPWWAGASSSQRLRIAARYSSARAPRACHRHPDRGHLRLEVADPDAEDQPAAGEHVEAGGLLGEHQRVALGEDDQAGAEQDPLGVRRRGGRARRAGRGSARRAPSAKAPRAGWGPPRARRPRASRSRATPPASRSARAARGSAQRVRVDREQADRDVRHGGNRTPADTLPPVLRRARLFVLVFVVAAGAALAGLAFTGEDDPPSFGPVTLDPGEPDPFAYEPGREEEFVERATAGHSHVLYAKSPGGVGGHRAPGGALAPARSRRPPAASRPGPARGDRVPRERRQPGGARERRPRGRGRADPDPGRHRHEPARHARGRGRQRAADAADAAPRADARGCCASAARSTSASTRARRWRAPVRYLKLARERFGREDLAVVSYHMGMGNLENVLDAYGDDDGELGARLLRRDAAQPPARLPAALRLRRRLRDLPVARLRGAGDHAPLPRRTRPSCAAARRCRRPRPPPRRCSTRARRRRSSRRPTSSRTAYRVGRAAAVRGRPRDAARPRRTGELAARLDAERRLYRGLRPEAYELAVYLAAGVRSVSGTRASLIVTSTVRDHRVPAPAGARQPVRHARVLAAHDRLRLRRAPRLREPGSGGGVPVHARPAPVAQPDRLGARAGRDPHHGVGRGDGCFSRPASSCCQASQSWPGTISASGVSVAYWRISRSERRNRCSSSMR